MTKSLILAAFLALGASAAVQAAPVAQNRQAPVRTATYPGGEGATWQTGRDAHAFTGTYGGCRYTGQAGPNGYTIDRVCR